MGKTEQEIVRMFREAGRLSDALGEAARHGELKLLREVLEEGVSPNAVNSVGSTPLNLAASGGKLEAIRLLIEFGADPNVVDLRKGETALFRCLWAMHPTDVYVSCCVELIRNGAKTDISNKSGMTFDELARSRGLSVERLRTLSQDQGKAFPPTSKLDQLVSLDLCHKLRAELWLQLRPNHARMFLRYNWGVLAEMYRKLESQQKFEL